MLAVGIAVTAAACQFSPSGQTPGGLDGGGGADARDAMVDPIDTGQPDPNCAWPFEPEHFDPCDPGRPAVVAPLALDLPGEYTYDTNTEVGLLTGPGDVPLPAPPATRADDIQIIWVDGFDIANGATLRVEGPRPLMIVSTGDIRVRGIIDVSSTWNPTSKDFDTGAGAEPADCVATPPQVGGECMHGGGGGGGGGFNGAGGAGGRGGNTRDCSGEIGVPGGLGGARLSLPPGRIRGGCAGQRGGKSDDEMLYGVGGAGGGAVHLVSQTRIDIEGAIHAGGAAGAGAENNRSGGGGGGSGGFIGIEAPDIEIDADATLAANGGGGGGGADNSPATAGEDGKLSDEAASGGPADMNGGNGGEGSAGGKPDGSAGIDAERGGGGGGGGAGFIIIYRVDPSIEGGATISPAHTRK